MSLSRPALKSTKLPDASVTNSTMSPSQCSVSYCVPLPAYASDGTSRMSVRTQPIVTCVGPVFVVVTTLVSVCSCFLAGMRRLLYGSRRRTKS